MTISEAMEWSKTTGKAFYRASGGGWVKYDPSHRYHLTVEELSASDWEPVQDERSLEERVEMMERKVAELQMREAQRVANDSPVERVW